ncbi:hypothetical protein H8959_017602 [Pygathrix nigripes]
MDHLNVLVENITMVTEFLLLGFSSLGEIQLALFAVFLFLYLAILSGNVTIISVIHLDKSLHTPMYFFLGILSTSETFYTFVILPKMLVNLLSVARIISFTCCALQMFFFLGFAITNCLLLGVMASYVSNKDRLVTVTYTIVTPLLNPMVYSLRNKDVQLAIRKVLGKKGSLKLQN